MSSLEMGLVLLVVLVLGVMWEWRRDRGAARRSSLETSLESDDPATVDEALTLIRKVGLAEHADALLRLVESDPPPETRRSVVDLVAGQQWEPVSSDSVRQLREWAAAEPERAPAPRPEPAAPSSDIETGLTRRVEEALEEPVTWIHAETPEGTLVVGRPDEERD